MDPESSMMKYRIGVRVIVRRNVSTSPVGQLRPRKNSLVAASLIVAMDPALNVPPFCGTGLKYGALGMLESIATAFAIGIDIDW